MLTEKSGYGDFLKGENVLSKEEMSCGRKKTSIGGQALIEGIMMRGPKLSAMAVRNTKGEIVLEKWENKVSKKPKILKLPIIRGVFNFVDSMKEGYKSLMRSAEISGLEELEAEAEREKAAKKAAKKAKKEASKGNRESVASDVPAQSDEAVSEQAETLSENTEAEEKDITEEKKSGFGALMNALMLVAMVLGVALSIVLFIVLP